MKKFVGILIVSLVLIGGSALPAEAKSKKATLKQIPITCIQFPPRPGVFYPAVCRIGKPLAFRF